MSSPYLAVDRQCTGATRLRPGKRAGSRRHPAAGSHPGSCRRPSLDQLPVVEAAVSGTIFGVTVSVLLLAKFAVSSTSPNTSAILTRMGPNHELAAQVERSWY